MTQERIIGFDTETFLIAPYQVAPKLVCATFAWRGDNGEIDTAALGNNDPAKLHDAIEEMFMFADKVVIANASFDLAVVTSAYPDLFPLVFQCLEDGKIICVQIYERLLNIARVGNSEHAFTPEGAKIDFWYDLASLVKQYLGKDRDAQKKDPHSWRLKFSELDGKPIEEYPEAARLYALEDAFDAVSVYEAQKKLGEEDETLLCPTIGFHTASSFALFLKECRGIITDPVAVEKFKSWLDVQMDPKTYQPLVAAGILRGDNTINTKVLKARVEQVCKERAIEVKQTDSGATSYDGDTMEKLAPFDPLFQLFSDRQGVSKLKSTYLTPLLSPIIHPSYNFLVSTGRCSSRGTPKTQKNPAKASVNIQNQPQRGGVRECFIPRPGFVFVSVDYEATELFSFGQKTFNLFGRSTHLEKYNAGYDLHAWLGAHIAAALEPNSPCWRRQELNIETADDIYKVFMGMKKSPDEAHVEFFKKYRKIAKPTGLGYPGGLGPDTFVEYARGDFGVFVTRDEAARLREIWYATYQEARPYFDWVNQQVDAKHVSRDGRERFKYTSPFGMIRSNCAFTECANGAALQTPSAEGARLADFAVARHCYDPSLNSCLLGSYPIAFIHDEILVEVPEDRYLHERAHEIARIMVDCMQYVMPDVKVRAQPAAMRRWDKNAEPLFKDGRLAVWEPTTR